MSTFSIYVKLNQKQGAMALKHYNTPRVNNMVADIQGTVQSFFDKLAEEDAAENEKKPAKESKIVFMTPVGIIEIEDDEDDD